jgi:hypothetical protein
MAKHIILVHGRNYKPDAANLKRNWVGALAHGIERDHGKRALNKFKKTRKTMVYYGDLSNAFLGKHTGKRWTKKREAADIQDRKEALAALKLYGTHEFNKKNYKRIRDLADVFKEAAANVFSGPLSLLGIGDDIVGLVAPDMEHYWNPDARFGSDVRWRLTGPLERAIKAGDDIMLISHSLGTIVSYDVLWKFSHYGEYQHLRDKKINTLVTIGSPLGDENVKKELKGVQAKTYRRYPHNIGRWVNFAAEDDYISHDPRLANDFKNMVRLGLTARITDKHIYNMAIRGGNSNPHHGAGYLIHPQMSRVVTSWLG